MIAASKNFVECLQLLLKSGALLEMRNLVTLLSPLLLPLSFNSSSSLQTGKTALVYADENQHDECSKLLIDAGASLFTGDSVS
jgi:ankyrin repeat protein